MGFNKDAFNPLLEKRFQKVYIADEVVKTIFTTDDTAQTVLLKVLAKSSVLNFTILVTAVQTGGLSGTTGDVYAREYRGAVKNISGITTFADVDTWYQDIAIDAALAGISIDIQANSIGDSIDIMFTGEVDKDLTVKIKLVYSEIKFQV